MTRNVESWGPCLPGRRCTGWLSRLAGLFFLSFVGHFAISATPHFAGLSTRAAAQHKLAGTANWSAKAPQRPKRRSPRIVLHHLPHYRMGRWQLRAEAFSNPFRMEAAANIPLDFVLASLLSHGRLLTRWWRTGPAGSNDPTVVRQCSRPEFRLHPRPDLFSTWFRVNSSRSCFLSTLNYRVKVAFGRPQLPSAINRFRFASWRSYS